MAAWPSGSACRRVSTLLFVLLPFPIKWLIDGVLIGDSLDLGPFGEVSTATTGEKLTVAAWIAGAYVVLSVAQVVTNAASFYVIARTALLMIHTLRSRLVAHLRTLSLRYFSNTSVGELIFRSINDARSIQEVMIFGFGTWATLALRIVLMAVFMAFLDPWLTLVALLVVPALAVTIRLLARRIQTESQNSRQHMGALTSHIEQTVGTIRAVQVFGDDADERERLEAISMRFVRAQLQVPVGRAAAQHRHRQHHGDRHRRRAVDGVAQRHRGHRDRRVAVGLRHLHAGDLPADEPGDVRVRPVPGRRRRRRAGVPGARHRARHHRTARCRRPGAVPSRAATRGGASLVHEGGRVALDGVDIVVRRGEKVALVGETGSGKTSVLNLLPRLYDVTAGRVTVDGVDVRDVTLASLRRQISVVSQEPLLFAASIRDNIRYGRLGATDAEVEAAATAPPGPTTSSSPCPTATTTEVGERGVKLSLGQQQRISIARAFLKDAPILLLDEPTSALDAATEADFLTSLEALMAGRTVVIVAHRLSTIRGADRIYVLDHGRVVECGTHAELLDRDGTYRRLHDHQLRPHDERSDATAGTPA